MKVKIVTTEFALIIRGTNIHILVVYRELLWGEKLHHRKLLEPEDAHSSNFSSMPQIILHEKQDCELLEPQTVWTNTVVWLHHLTSHLIMTWLHSFPPTDQKPTMSQLISLQGRTQHVNIVEGIGVKWMMVGTTLLDDKDYTIVPAIAEQYGNNAQRINMEILGRWVRGEGMSDCSWRALLGVLREHCGALADRVEEALMAEEAEQGKSGPL